MKKVYRPIFLSPFTALALFNLWLYRQIFYGGILFGSDNLLTGVTVRSFARAFWQQFGRLPGWNPYLCGGVPYLGNFVSVGFYPLNWALMGFAPHTAMNLMPLLHTTLGALFTYLSFRLISGERSAALLAAGLYLVGGATVMRLFGGHYDALAVISWGAGVFYFWTAYGYRHRPYFILGATLALALQILAGYPQYVYLTHGLIAPWIVAIYFKKKGFRKKGQRPGGVPATVEFWLALALYLTVGIGLAAVQWVPALELLGDSVRQGGVDWHYLTNYSLNFRQLFSLFLPHLFGDGLREHYHGIPYIWECTAYLGLASLPLALQNDWRLKRHCWGAALLMLFILLSLGATLPWFYRTYLELMPLQKIFRVPGRFLMPLSWLYLFWVASGFARWRAGLNPSPSGPQAGPQARPQADSPFHRYWRLVVVLGAVLLCLLATIPSFRTLLIGTPITSPLAVSALWIAGLAALMVQGLIQFSKWRGATLAVILLVLFDLTFAHARYFGTTGLGRYAPPPFDFGRWRVHSLDRQNKILTQAPMHGYFHMAGREAMITPRFNAFLNTMVQAPLTNNQDNFQLGRFDPLMSLASVRYLVADQPLEDLASLKHLGHFDEMQIYENSAALPRVFFVKQLKLEPNWRAIFVTMRRDPKSFATTAYLEQPVVQENSPMQLGLPSNAPELIAWQADGSLWKLPTLAEPTFLVLTDTFARGWRATIDYREVPIQLTNGFMQGVLIPPHSQELRLQYEPPGLPLGQLISGLAAILWLMALAWLNRQRRREKRYR